MELDRRERERWRWPARWLLAVHAAALVLLAVWFRCESLGHLPGINGDETWYGIQALRWLREHRLSIQTPTGNPANPFFLGPMVLLHAVFPPSIALLRSVAVGSGLAALGINWWLCRRVVDRRTAAVSTVMLAVLPVNVAYSRFAWDASQSVAATLPVLYCSLAVARFRDRPGRWTAAAVVALIVAVWVHPTNLFAAGPLVAAWAAQWRWDDVRQSWVGNARARAIWLGGAVLAVVLVVLLAAWLWTPEAGRFVRRLGDLRELVWPQTEPHVALSYPRLLMGGSIYRGIAGSASWLEWPGTAGPPTAAQGWGLDVVLFWAILAAAVWYVWRSWKATGRMEDRVLITGWALELAALLLLAGPRALAPGWERYALCLVGPTVLLVSRGAALGWTTCSGPGKAVLAVASLSGWLVLADFHAHYFRFIERTGGGSSDWFRTADVEPKLSALRSILEQRGPGKTWIASRQWHINLPLYYLAMGEADVMVVPVEPLRPYVQPVDAVPWDTVWWVEFAGSEESAEARENLAVHPVREWQFLDYGGRPVLSVLHRR